MRCPRDGGGLQKVERAGTPIDCCTTCGGVWFDVGELAHLGDPDVETAAARVTPAARLSRIGCPRCAGDCHESLVGEVVVDVCASCHGLWLDAGELEAARHAVVLLPKPTGFAAFLQELRAAGPKSS